MITQALKWVKVSKKNPCPICHRSDWCCIGKVYVNCMRVESDLVCKNGGWLHKIGDDLPKPVLHYRPEPRPVINAAAMWQVWRLETTPTRLEWLSENLGVSVNALNLLGCAWAMQHQAYAFPMRTGSGVVVGIRLRSTAGDQWAVAGSRAGLFIPDFADFADLSTLYVTEGASDCAAMLDFGFPAIGRQSCIGQESWVAICVLRNRSSRVVIVADADDPGQRGAVRLQASLPVRSVIWTPPTKDVREFKRAGGTAEMIRGNVKDLMPNRQISCSTKGNHEQTG